MQNLPKASESDVTQDEVELAIMLIQYHRNSFDVRSAGIVETKVDPPEVRELLNFILWLGNGFGIVERGNHTLGLHQIIQTSAIEMKEMLEYIRKRGADRQTVQDVNFLQDQMEAADTLAGYLIDG